VKAFILQTCYVQDRVVECSTTENCYLLLTVQGREQDISEDKVTALWVVTLRSDVGYPPHCYMVLQCDLKIHLCENVECPVSEEFPL
jgi:hypothetical protein